MLRFPYGISHFPLIRKEHYLYLDRTHLLSELEAAGRQLIFLRPRRFGKSLWVSTLASYYDVKQAEQFENLFGDLAVGQQATAEHNQYLVLQWDFSAVSPQGDIEQIKSHLFTHLNEAIKGFISYYAAYLTEKVTIYPDNGIGSFEALAHAVKNSGYQLYLLIDEYDNFANEVLMHHQGSKARYLDLLAGEGILKSLFKVIKTSASQGSIARVFITGVSPVVLSDMTSGYNVATPISLEDEFNELCGVTENELGQLVAQVFQECDQSHEAKDAALNVMQDFYNGYRFCNNLDLPRLYNPTLCFYFLSHYQKRCEAPRQMLDGNLATDAGRIRYIAQLPEGHRVLEQVMDEEHPLTLSYLETHFGVEQLSKLQQDSRYMVSLMYFLGILTIDDVVGLGDLQLGIPNAVIQALYVEQLLEETLPDPKDQQTVEKLAKAFYQTADLQPIADYMEQKYFAAFNNRDYRWSNELTVKTAFMTLLYSDIWYMVESGTALQRRYSDLLMLIRPSMRHYDTLKDLVLEFKYISLKHIGLTAGQLREESRETLMQLPIVQTALQEALTQLQAYQASLAAKYQQPERLYCIAVVALGFERVVWQALK